MLRFGVSIMRSDEVLATMGEGSRWPMRQAGSMDERAWSCNACKECLQMGRGGDPARTTPLVNVRRRDAVD